MAAPKNETRLALVVGNAAYRSGRLATAANDAGLVTQGLAQLGFDVTAMGDVDAPTLRKTLDGFRDAVRGAGGSAVVFVYLSGYGVQYAGENYYVPVDARIDHQSDVPGAAVPLAEVQQAIEALPAQARIFVYDLSRDNPLAKADAIPLARGLTLLRAPTGSLYAFNAAPDTIDRPDLALYGRYARALVEALRTPGLTVQALFTRVRLRITELTGGATIPWDDSALDADVTLLAADAAPPSRTSAAPPSIEGLTEEAAYWAAIAEDRLATYQAFVRFFPAEGLAARFRAVVAVRLEAATWSESVRANAPAAYWTYMQRYPRGPHYVDVRRRLALLHAALEPPSRFDLYDFATLAAPSPDQVRDIERGVSFDAPDGSLIPAPPDLLLMPVSPATEFELAPAPLVPVGVLPVPAPLPPVAATAWREMPGWIHQPFVPGLGLVSIETRPVDGGTAMTLSTEAGIITRTVTTEAKDGRTILQTDEADEILSRILVSRDGGTSVTILQTGSRGETLARVTTHIDPLGARLTTLMNDRDQRVVQIRADRRGVPRDITSGQGSLADMSFPLPSLQDRPAAVSKPETAPHVPSPDGPRAPAGDVGPRRGPDQQTGAAGKGGQIRDAIDTVVPKAVPGDAAPAARTPDGPPAADDPSPQHAAPAVPMPIPRPAATILKPRPSVAPRAGQP